jgi:hypothetical protein
VVLAFAIVNSEHRMSFLMGQNFEQESASSGKGSCKQTDHTVCQPGLGSAGACVAFFMGNHKHRMIRLFGP